MNDLNARSKTIAAIGARIETTNNPHPRTGKKKKKKKELKDWKLRAFIEFVGTLIP
jgi:hypothetical protein